MIRIQFGQNLTLDHRGILKHTNSVPHFERTSNKAFIKISHPENWACISKLLANGNQYLRTFAHIPSISCNQGPVSPQSSVIRDVNIKMLDTDKHCGHASCSRHWTQFKSVMSVSNSPTGPGAGFTIYQPTPAWLLSKRTGSTTRTAINEAQVAMLLHRILKSKRSI